MKSLVKIYIQDYNKIASANKFPLHADWNLERNLKKEYKTDLVGIDAAEQAFKIFNKENLTQKEREILGDYNAPSLSVGDVVEVHPLLDHKEKSTAMAMKKPTAYLCDSFGWKERPIPALSADKSSQNKKEYKYDNKFNTSNEDMGMGST
jgi:hypothetical protein